MSAAGAAAASFNPDEAKSQLNQYWYSQKTIRTLIKEVQMNATSCAFLSTPSLFFALDERRGDEDEAEDAALRQLRRKSKIFEYDKQWAGDEGYVFYNYEEPEKIPVQYFGAFDYVVVDPPFITAEVWEAYMTTVKLLLKREEKSNTTNTNNKTVEEEEDRPKYAGKVLFTTVLENHSMLEHFFDGPLFIPVFRPLVRCLTYQYVCFLNYQATVLSHTVNEEVEAEEPQLRAAIEMANSIRESETAFAEQLRSRRREEGDTFLPTKAYELERAREKEQRIKDQLHRRPAAAAAPGAENPYAVDGDWATMKVEEMPWGYIPEGLSMYPEEEAAAAAEKKKKNDENDNNNNNNSAGQRVHDHALALRQKLDAFKGSVDALQKHLNQQLLMKVKVLKLRKSINERKAAGESVAEEEEKTLVGLEGEAKGLQAEWEAQLAVMERFKKEAEADEETLFALLSAFHHQQEEEEKEEKKEKEEYERPAYLGQMEECLERYHSVPITKSALLELASAATGRYKAPVYNRMKVLLQEIKEIKKTMT